VAVPSTIDRLDGIEHIVVLMMENRSFDHTLGYLSLPDDSDRPPAPDVDGLRAGDQRWVNIYTGDEFPALTGTEYRTEPLYPPKPHQVPAMTVHWQDPPHEAEYQAIQLRGGTMTGFVDAYAKVLAERSPKRPAQAAPRSHVLGYPMAYLTADDVPVYDHLAREFCVCDKWFCSLRGPTMPNRFFALAGTTDGILDNAGVVLHRFGEFRSFFQLLPAGSWRYYSSDPAVLRAVDDEYAYDDDSDRFAYFDQFTNRQRRSFLSDVFGSDDQGPELPAVAWIDPNFSAALEPGQTLSDDDHPPTRPIHGQRLVHKIYEALRLSDRYRDKTLLVVTYDEHGGFHDHVPPPDRGDHGLGVRVPTLLVSTQVQPGACHVPFDHASIIKTILLKFGAPGALAEMPPEVDYDDVHDLGAAFAVDGEPIQWRPVDHPGDAALTDDDLVPTYLARPASTVPRALELIDTAPTDLQRLIGTIAVRLRAGVRDARPLVNRGLLFARAYAHWRRKLRFRKKKRLLAERHP
jgi:phospholipase C